MRSTSQSGHTPATPHSHNPRYAAHSPSLSRVRTALTAVAAAGALLTAGVFSLSHAPAAHAHDELVGYSLIETSTTEPAASPAGFQLNFNNELTQMGAEVIATDTAGTSIAQGEPELNDRDLTQNFVPNLDAGEYPITWTVVSSDGHRISGALSLTVSENAPATLTLAEIPSVSSENAPPTENAAENSETAPNSVLIISASIAGVGVLAALIVLMVRKMRDTQSGNQSKGMQS